MVTRSSAQMHVQGSKDTYQFHPQIWEGFHNSEMIPDSQCAIKIKLGFSVFSIYTSLQAGGYHIKKITHFIAAVWLELGLAPGLA